MTRETPKNKSKTNWSKTAKSALDIIGQSLGNLDSATAVSSQIGLLGLNSVLAENSAKLARSQAKENARLVRRSSSIQLGMLTDDYIRSGVSLSGSPLLQIQDLARENELAAQKQLFEGEIAATNAINQAKAAEFQKKSLKHSQNLQTAGSILGAVGSAASASSSKGTSK